MHTEGPSVIIFAWVCAILPINITLALLQAIEKFNMQPTQSVYGDDSLHYIKGTSEEFTTHTVMIG